MNKNFKIIIALICVVMIDGCKPKKAFDTEKENNIIFDSIVVSERYYLLGDSTNPYCTLESVFIFPAGYEDQESLKKLNNHFINAFFGEDTISATPKIAMDKYVEKYIADYKELENDFVAETKVTGEKPSQESWFAY